MKTLTRVNYQRGASLITAIFIITALAAIAALMTRQTIHSTTETTNEYLSSQALYAAETGVDRAVYDILYNGGAGAGVITDASIPGVAAWYTTTVVPWPIESGANIYYEITSTGEAGGTSVAPTVSRRLVVYFMP